MCTVIFIPADNKCFFASLRDENPKRQMAMAPDIYTINDVSILFPVDPVAGGTWIGVNEFGNTIILLNGGFEKHLQKKQYRKSRGLIVSELLTSPKPVTKWNLMDMDDIEPYTLIAWTGGNLFQLVWDGTNKHSMQLDVGVPYIWSSSTLYNAEVKAYREELFQHWIAMNPIVSKRTVLNFLQSFKDNENGFIMNRNDQTKTVSYSFIKINYYSFAVMDYHDFLNNSYGCRTINLADDLQRGGMPGYLQNEPMAYLINK